MDARAFTQSLLDELALLTESRFRNSGDSSTLSQAWQIIPVGDNERVVRNPFFWAKFYYLGRGTVRPVRKSFLVWFKNPKEDPRLKPPPMRRDQQRMLTRSQFLRALRQGRLIVAKRSGPYSGRADFKQTLGRLPRVLGDTVERKTLEFLRSLVPTTNPQERVARGRL